MRRAGTDPFVERVREATDIVALIGALVELKKLGARYRGLCPFHSERTPSFYVSPEHQSYHCFGCGESGDAFSFLMGQEKMTFPEALRSLADRAGLPMPDRRGPSSDLLERVRQALQLARGFFRAELAAASGARARDYLARRGIDGELAERYGLGAAPDGWDGLLQQGRRLMSERALVEAGLAIEGEKGRTYDRFRNRLMIPIDSAGGSPVGFGGRSLGDEEPKYLNSPETSVYRKGTVLFGIPQARDGIKDEGRVLVVEGYFDVIGLAQHGLRNAVGTCGTALTPEQIGLLKRFGAEVVFLFDGDGAGFKAALRALGLAAGVLPRVRVLRPPEGQDPDDWVRQAGAEAVRERIAGAPTPLAFLEEAATVGRLSRREALGQAAQLITRIEDPIERELWVQDAGVRFGVAPQAFRAEASRTGNPGGGVSVVSDRAGAAMPPAKPAAAARPLTRLEGYCLASALEWPDWADALAEALAGEGDRVDRTVELLRWIAGQERDRDGEDRALRGKNSAASLASAAVRELPDAALLIGSVMRAEAPAWRPDVLLARLALRGCTRQMAEIQRNLRRAEERGDRDEVERLAVEKLSLKRAEMEARRILDGSEAAAPESPSWDADAGGGDPAAHP